MHVLISSLIAASVSHFPPNPGVGLPAGYNVRQAGDFGIVCDGITDNTFALQTAFNRLAPREALQLPDGICITSDTVSLRGKRDVIIFGGGKDRTIIKAINPLRSAFIVSNGDAVSLRALQLYSPNAVTRSTDANARGFYIERSGHVTIDGVKVSHTSGAGILFYVVNNSKIINSDVVDNLADAFHITGASRDILAQFNTARGSGDDCFASIGYGARPNHNIRFLDNSCSDNQASGISFEGTIGGQAYRNKLTRTGVAGIRIASQKGYNTGAVQDIVLSDNVLSEVKTRPEVDHGAIMIFSTLDAVRNIVFSGTVVIDPHASIGGGIFNRASGTMVSNITVKGSRYTSTNRRITACFKIGSRVTDLIFKDNNLNEGPCGAHNEMQGSRRRPD